MSLQEAIEAARGALLAAAPSISEQQAQTSLALVTLRVQSEGLGVPYSTNPVPVFFFANRALNAGGRQYVKAKQKVKGPERGLGTWEEFKQAQGFGSGSVNLTYSGRMFRSLTTLFAGMSGTVYVSRIVAADAESAWVVGYNMDRYGDFLQPNATELAEVQQVGQVALAKIIQTYFPSA